MLYARQWCGTPEDVVQKAFIKLVRQKRPPADVVAWLYRVVRNGALDTAKSARRRQRRESVAARPARWFVEPEVDGLDARTAVAALEGLLPGASRGNRGPSLGRVEFLANRDGSRLFGQHRIPALHRRCRRAAQATGGDMSETFLERLSRFTPDASGLDRDALLFAAGRNSVRPHRGWVTVTSLLAATQALSLVLLWPRPNPSASPSTMSIATAPIPQRALEPHSSQAFPSPPRVLSARPSLLESDIEAQPAADITFIDQEPPLRAVGPLPASLLN